MEELRARLNSGCVDEILPDLRKEWVLRAEGRSTEVLPPCVKPGEVRVHPVLSYALFLL